VEEIKVRALVTEKAEIEHTEDFDNNNNVTVEVKN
jgi:hypothetical protein